MDKPIDLAGFMTPAHAEGADAERLWQMRGALAGSESVAPLASIVRARQRLAEETANRVIAERRERVTAHLRRQELWAGWRRRRPLMTPKHPGGAA